MRRQLMFRFAAPSLLLLFLVLSAAIALVACGGLSSSTSSPTPSITAPTSNATVMPAAQADLQVKEGVHAIAVALQSWAVAQPSSHYPAKATRAVLGTSMPDPWPINPFTGADMKPGAGRGDYRYRVSASRKQCTVTSRLSDGSAYTPQVLYIQ
jgi:hypothetical protein